MKTIILRIHDEKLFGFWGGIYEMPEIKSPDGDDYPDVAAICNHPQAKELAHLFCAAPAMQEALAAAVEMRKAQNAYFQARRDGGKGTDELRASKAAEKKFDDLAKALAGKVDL